jgi:hypothetical protein
MAVELGWDDATTDAHLDQYRALCAAEETAGDDPTDHDTTDHDTSDHDTSRHATHVADAAH